MLRGEEFDWVIVGAGSTGGVAAARATENPRVRVLLLEAGADYPRAIPSDLASGGRNSVLRHDWGFGHVPTTGQRVPFVFPRGRVVGGSSSVNTCIALRGRPYDYDEWNSPDWTWEKCLPAFKRLETDLDFPESEWHGKRGPIRIRRHPRSEQVEWQAAFLDSCKLQGIPDCPDHNDPRAAGAGPHAMNKVGGERQSVLRCYLTSEVRRRENLRIEPNVHVRRVIFEGTKATGLEIERDGLVETLHCNRIMLSAGAINTPGVMLRSGVGPRERVEKIGVTLVRDLPSVGARLLDHHGAAIFFVPSLGVVDLDDPLIQTLYRYTSEGSPYPNDMQIQAGSLLPFPWITIPIVSLMAVVGKPVGCGEIHWDSADPHARPRILSHVLERDDDRARAIAALRRAYEIAQSEPMRSIARMVWPRHKTLFSDRMNEAIRSACDSGYHPCGTVPMHDAVDSRGRVRGTANLYVADASIMPTIPSANTNLTCIMMGERFGEWMSRGEL
ncbi:MAG TPA: GMC family oxidoreductase [Polyangiaceae bacterium]|nr:GMC family oxidoreductase [Polyangiaceae bacterium]